MYTKPSLTRQAQEPGRTRFPVLWKHIKKADHIEFMSCLLSQIGHIYIVQCALFSDMILSSQIEIEIQNNFIKPKGQFSSNSLVRPYKQTCITRRQQTVTCRRRQTSHFPEFNFLIRLIFAILEIFPKIRDNLIFLDTLKLSKFSSHQLLNAGKAVI